MTLQQAITSKGWPKSHLARKTGLNRRTIYRLLEGKYYPSFLTAQKLTSAFGHELDFNIDNQPEDTSRSHHD